MTKLIDLPKHVIKTLQTEGKKQNLKVKPFIEKLLIEMAQEYTKQRNITL